MELKNIAQKLFDAENGHYQISALTVSNPGITIEDAYAIQLENTAKKVAAGERVIGMKIGLTSKGMQNLLHVNEPDYGHLTDRMLLMEDEICSIDELIQPKVEGELAFCLKKTLCGPEITVEDVYDATEWVVPAIEIVDSRIKDWKLALCDTIADNGSSARFVLGSHTKPITNVDMRLTGMTLEKNGELINSGTCAEVLGNPAAAVAWLANKLSAFGVDLKAGSIVMSGALTAAQSAEKGDSFTVSFYGMGSLTVKFN